MKAKKERSHLQAGVEWIDITPPMGTQIAGDIGRYRPATSVKGRTYARALVLRSGRKTACILSTDVATITRRHSARVRKEIAKKLGTVPEAVMVHAMQSHSTPALARDENPYFPGNLGWLNGTDSAYIEQTVVTMIEAAVKASKKLQPVTIRIGRTNDGRAGSNRRFIRRDGTANMHPGVDDPGVLCIEGPSDPEVGVAVLDGPDGKPLSAILSYTCHPCHGFDFNWISGDWPAEWCNGVRGMLGEQCLPIVLNGACGNIHSRDHMNRSQVDTIEYTTGCLLESTGVVLPRLQVMTDDRLDWAVQKFNLPLRPKPTPDIKKARAYLAANPTPVWTDDIHISWDWMFAAWEVAALERPKSSNSLSYEIQVIRLGDLAITGWMGEPFVELQLDVKLKCPAPYLFGVHMCNDGVSYIPTRDAFKRGGYEVRRSRFKPDALEKITGRTRAMLKKLF